ncbi:MAG TPA: 4a-hydroxytetrahydrobiopterin dehydratase [Spirochaetia bacterium]|nr:4a-hydroxytetrahydrobiopterin dehydratase [Spirochaetia bacterium]
MSELSKQECAPCRGDEPPLDKDEIATFMSALSDEWEIVERKGVPRLRRKFSFRGFRPALDFTTTVGRIAEEQAHHPRIVTQWGSVTVDWWTHKIDGLHNNDFIMAARCDDLYHDS